MKKIIASISLFMFPISAFGAVTNANSLFALVDEILGKILPIIIAIAVVWFIYNVFNYAILSKDEEAKATAKNNMIWGIIALFVMVSVWGLVNILGGTLGLVSNPPPLPQIKF